jgi:hypothetical protein
VIAEGSATGSATDWSQTTAPIDTGAPDSGNWSLAAVTLASGSSSVPALEITGSNADDTSAEAIIFEYWKDDGVIDPATNPDDPTWSVFGTLPPSTTKVDITSIEPGADYYAAVTYVVSGAPGDRLVLGPVTAGSLSAAVADGDYGDVTVGSGGTTFDINDDVVTFPKLQDIATKRVIGRNTAGSGDPEEVTVDQLLDWIAGTAAQGDIFYRGASGIKRLAAGTSGFLLKTNGAGADPSWIPSSSAGASTWTVAGTWAWSANVTNVDITGLGGYSEIIVIARAITTSSSGFRVIRVSVDGGSTFFNASGDYKSLAAAGSEANGTEITGHSSATTGAITITSHIHNNLAGQIKISTTQGGNQVLFVGSNSVINAIRLDRTAGNITGGNMIVLGRA